MLKGAPNKYLSTGPQIFSYATAQNNKSCSRKEAYNFTFQIFAVVVSSWPSLACGASLGFITPALPLLQCPDKGVPNVSEDHLSWMASLTMLGALVGASLSGPCLAMGRRSALWVASLPLAISWAGLALAHAPWPLLLTHTVSIFLLFDLFATVNF